MDGSPEQLNESFSSMHLSPVIKHPSKKRKIEEVKNVVNLNPFL